MHLTLATIGGAAMIFLLPGTAILAADPTLTFVEFIQDGDGGTPDGLRGANSAVVSPDGKHVYIGTRQPEPHLR